jgi:transcriptional regulator with XRE-family HTH domain
MARIERKQLNGKPKKADWVDAYVGSRIRARRMAVGMSQDALAEKLGLTFQQVQKYEKGINRVGAGRLWNIAKILDVPITYFYEGVQGDDQSASAESEDSFVFDFLSSREGQQLAQAFQQISDRHLRRHVIGMVKAMSEDRVAAK